MPPAAHGLGAGVFAMDETDIRRLLDEGRRVEAFERIVDGLDSKIFHLALGMTRNHATAADLAQEALVRVWKALPAYNGSASLSTWIYTIARNVCLNEIARAARRPAVSLDAPESAGIAEGIAAREPSVSHGAAADIESLMSRLPERSRRVLGLFYLEQKSHEETAALLGLPVGTVKTHLFRARKELARLALGDASAGSDLPIETP